MDKAGLSHAVQSRDISETDFRVLCREALWRCVFCRLPHQWLQPGKGKICRALCDFSQANCSDQSGPQPLFCGPVLTRVAECASGS